MKKLLVLTILLFQCSVIYGQFDPFQTAGIYQHCYTEQEEKVCTTVRLNNDFTFDFLKDGGLIVKDRAKGDWKFIDNNNIHLESSLPEFKFKSYETQNVNQQNMVIYIVDIAGAALPGMKVKTKASGIAKQFLIPIEGVVEIPKTEEIEFEGYNAVGRYKIKNPRTNYLKIMIYNFNSRNLNRIFTIEKGKLVFDGDIYKKLSVKKTSKLFPK